MEYTVVEKYTLIELITEVNKLIRAGWIPFEGLVVGTNFYQALTKGDFRIVQEAQKKNSLEVLSPA
jgi:hypothetical protein